MPGFAGWICDADGDTGRVQSVSVIPPRLRETFSAFRGFTVAVAKQDDAFRAAELGQEQQHISSPLCVRRTAASFEFAMCDDVMLLAPGPDTLPMDDLAGTKIVEIIVTQPISGRAKLTIDQNLSCSRVVVGFHDESN